MDTAEIIARFEIQQAKSRHLRALDTKDWETYAVFLTEDFVLDTSAASGMPPVEGREQAVATVRAMTESAVMVHHAHSPEFTFTGDEAAVIWAMQDRMVRGADQPSMAGFGHHHDVWVQTDAGWKLRSQRLTRLHTDVFPPTGAP